MEPSASYLCRLKWYLRIICHGCVDRVSCRPFVAGYFALVPVGLSNWRLKFSRPVIRRRTAEWINFSLLFGFWCRVLIPDRFVSFLSSAETMVYMKTDGDFRRNYDILRVIVFLWMLLPIHSANILRNDQFTFLIYAIWRWFQM
ncbi:hypothetical protein COCON_G00058230 [Conger conger]|uniref:Uncharacterized protein n=1 Tax=Conger conger TaxID=82655 RepID=A0A9Q1DR20_CONCO|nr:hypothetical protein COCON_G00058230 [Conger conger]